MDHAGYTILTRQSGLAREMQIVANNIANAATTGFRSEGMIFSEYVRSAGIGESLSMGQGNVGRTSFEQGALRPTGSPLDLALEGGGFFQVETPAGPRLTRSGAFTTNAQSELVTQHGYPVIDADGAPVFVPPGVDVAISPDGTVSADGVPLGQVGVVTPIDPLNLVREDGVLFRADAGVDPDGQTRVLQGFVESANVNAVHQLARMIEVQRAYELGQSFLESEDERVRGAMRAIMTQS